MIKKLIAKLESIYPYGDVSINVKYEINRFRGKTVQYDVVIELDNGNGYLKGIYETFCTTKDLIAYVNEKVLASKLLEDK